MVLVVEGGDIEAALFLMPVDGSIRELEARLGSLFALMAPKAIIFVASFLL